MTLTAALAELLEAAEEAREFIADHGDTVDGPDGTTLPNKAMRLAAKLGEAIAGVNEEAREAPAPPAPSPTRAKVGDRVRVVRANRDDRTVVKREIGNVWTTTAVLSADSDAPDRIHAGREGQSLGLWLMHDEYEVVK